MEYKGPPSMTEEEIYDFLNQMKIARICTLNKDGTVHSAPVWYLLRDKQIFFSTPIKSKKARNIKRNSVISVMVDNQSEQSKGVIVYGTPEILLPGDEGYTDDLAMAILSRYMDKQAAEVYWAGLQKIGTWCCIVVTPKKFDSFDYVKDDYYGKAVRGEL